MPLATIVSGSTAQKMNSNLSSLAWASKVLERVSSHIGIVCTMIATGTLAFAAQTQQPCAVDLPCNGISRFAEYGNIPTRDERAVLDRLAKALRMSDQIVYVLVYAGREACVDGASRRAQRIKSYLVKKYAIDAGRIVLKDGGFKVDLSTELWLLPRTRSLPEPSPQLDRAQVNLGKCRLPSLNPR